jgi:DNA-binding response OmpR family regulator
MAAHASFRPPEATRRIRAGGRSDLPIIAMTANAFGEDRSACLAAGMNDHLAKPVHLEILYSTLARWLPASEIGPGRASSRSLERPRAEYPPGNHPPSTTKRTGLDLDQVATKSSDLK